MIVQVWIETQQHWRRAQELKQTNIISIDNTLDLIDASIKYMISKTQRQNPVRAIISLSPLIVCVNETATAANETLLVTWPSAWHTATGKSSFKRFESIGYTEKPQLYSIYRSVQRQGFQMYHNKWDHPYRNSALRDMILQL